MYEVVRDSAFHGIMPVVFLIEFAGVAAAVCFQRPVRSFAGKMVFGALCAPLLSFGCMAAGVSSLPAHVLLVLVLGMCASKCGWRRTVLSLGCWAFVTYMLLMALRVPLHPGAHLQNAAVCLLPPVAFPCVLALLLSVHKSPVRFWSAFVGVFLVLYVMQVVGAAGLEHTADFWAMHKLLLVREVVYGVMELALLCMMFIHVLQAPPRRALWVLALYSLRTVFVVYMMLAR